ncbi:MAG: CHAT domain-containing protein [Planctomycetaceae bacterium]|nr:CHAT domain-containing protein [Planctomycetaceae bacterium]
MAGKIIRQLLGISPLGGRDRRDEILFAPGELGELDGGAPPAVKKPVNWDRIRLEVTRLTDRVRELTTLACMGRTRDATRVEEAAHSRSRHVLPDEGFVSVVEPEIHPHLDVLDDRVAQIPWEALEECYVFCERCQPRRYEILAPGAAEESCRRCREPMTRGGGKLSLQRHLTYRVRSQGATSGRGRDFLFVIDPRNDLLSAEFDSQRVCRDSCAELKQLVTQRGFRVVELKRGFATIEAVLQAVRSPELAGMYYFGHGTPPDGGNPGSLLLADGKLEASDPELLGATPRFVFLNACWGGAGGGGGTFESRCNSVAEAFARGPRKVVIASLFPLVNSQAAAAAVTCFRAALDGERSLAEALQEARRESLARYDSNQPDIGWLAYRYFGDPNERFPEPPVPAPPVVITPTDATTADPATPPAGGLATTSMEPVPASLFDDDGRMSPDQYGFDMRSVLLRAARRRNGQHRQRVTAVDLLAGMFRVCQLTRKCARSLHWDPDAVYEELRTTPEKEPSEPQADLPEIDPGDDTPEARNRVLLAFLDRWVIRLKQEFSDSALELFDRAARSAARAGRASGDGRIHETDLLGAYLDDSGWQVETDASLPTAAAFRNGLATLRQNERIDSNGNLILTGLTAGARLVIERAHEHAQQRGQSDVGTRLLLASFLHDPNGPVATSFKESDVDTDRLRAFLIESTDGRAPTTFALGCDSAERLVLPMIEQAQRIHARAGERADGDDPERINESELFQGFCGILNAEVKRMFRDLKEGLGVDLDGVARRLRKERGPKPAPFDEKLQSALQAAGDFARCQGHAEIRSPHLVAGLLTVQDGALTESLKSKGISPWDALRTALLLVVPSSPTANTPGERAAIRLSANVETVLAAARRLSAGSMASAAHSLEGSTLAETHVVAALLRNPPPVVRQIFQSLEGGGSNPSRRRDRTNGQGKDDSGESAP